MIALPVAAYVLCASETAPDLLTAGFVLADERRVDVWAANKVADAETKLRARREKLTVRQRRILRALEKHGAPVRGDMSRAARELGVSANYIGMVANQLRRKGLLR